MTSAQAETLLKKIRKLESNLTCPNCGSESSAGLGFGSVCVKFKTFVCDMCKTSHQAISHRVKSVTMSEWTMDEVKDLTAERMGGNEVALHVWLQNAPPVGGKYPGGKRPKKGDQVDVFKQFVVDCYESGMFRSSEPFQPGTSATNTSTNTHSATNSGVNSGATSPRPTHSNTVPSNHSLSPVRARSNPTPATVNLLDMNEAPVVPVSASTSGNNNDMFFAFPNNSTHTSVPMNTHTNSAINNNGFGGFDDPFFSGTGTGSQVAIPPAPSTGNNLKTANNPSFNLFDDSIGGNSNSTVNNKPPVVSRNTSNNLLDDIFSTGGGGSSTSNNNITFIF